jgi:hypothetical protein
LNFLFDIWRFFLRSITKKIKDFAIQKHVKDSDRGERTTMKDLSLMIKKMPQYQKELNAYALHFNIAEQCMNTYNRDSGEKLCSVEQVILIFNKISIDFSFHRT